MLKNVDKLKKCEIEYLMKTEGSIWDYFEMLKKYSDFENCNSISPRIIAYEDVNSPNLVDIRKQMNLDILKEGDDEIKYLIFLKKYAYDMLNFEGKSLNQKTYDNLSFSEIINDARNKGYALNCRYISYIFCQMLLSVGFKARWVVCLSSDLYNNECHCVTEVYVNKLKKWVVVDASFGTFYFGERGELLNLYEMRNLYVNGKMPILVADDSKHVKNIQLYWIKNIFRFRFIAYNGTNALKKEQLYWGLNPKGFKMRDKSYYERDSEVKVSINYFNNAKMVW